MSIQIQFYSETKRKWENFHHAIVAPVIIEGGHWIVSRAQVTDNHEL